MSATAPGVGRLADLGHDPDARRPGSPAELAVAADGGRQRVGPEPLAGPEDHELEGAVDRQRVGQPARAERPLDPGRGRGRRADPARDPALAAALDPLDPLQGRAVEQDAPIDLVVRSGRAAGSAGSSSRRVAGGVPVGEHDLAPGRG